MKVNPAFRTQYLIILGLFLIAVWLGWVGYLGSDDAVYLDGAYGWLEQFPFVGGHGSIRYTITWPLALSLSLFGENEVAAALPSIGFACALLFVIMRWCARQYGTAASLAAGICFATSPLIAIGVSFASIDIVETFFLLCSGLLFVTAAGNKTEGGVPSASKLIAAGACAGAAFLTRETSVFFILFYGVLFLVSYGMKRRFYWWMALGFFAVWGAEVLYLWVMTGDPVYRVTIALNHDSTINRSVDLAGNLLVHPLVDPLFVVLFNQEFTFLFWIVLLLVFLRLKSRRKTVSSQDPAIFFLGGAVAWFLCAGAATSLLPLNPRYFMVSLVFVLLWLGGEVQRYWDSRANWRRHLLLGGLLLVSANLGVTFLENKSVRFPEKTLIELAKSVDETVYVDPNTYQRARHLMRWGGVKERISFEPPRVGALIFYNPAELGRVTANLSADAAPLYKKQGGWVLVQHRDAPARSIAPVLSWFGFENLLPDRLHRLIYKPHEGVNIYRWQHEETGDE